MTTKPTADPANATSAATAGCTPVRVLTPAAQRALQEAAERRQHAADQAANTKEIGGREGPEPTRFGDWEKGGIASDF